MTHRFKQWLKRMDAKFGAWLCRKFPKFAPPNVGQSIGFSAGQGFSADLQIKVIRKDEKEKLDTQSETTGFRTFWNRMGTKR